MLSEIRKVLVVVAHPDDEVLGCGGTILKLSELYNAEVKVMFLNNGFARTQAWDQRKAKEEIYQVAGQLLFTPIIKEYKTGKFDTYPLGTFVQEIQQVVDKFQPDTIITHDRGDLHNDHKVVHDAVMVCSRFKPTSSIRNVLTMPVISSSEINPAFNFVPNYYVDISNYVYEKIDAMAYYEQEQRVFSELRGAYGIKGWGMYYGMHIQVDYAEGFKIIRSCN